MFCLPKTGPVHPCSFSFWYWEIKDSLSLRKAIFLTMKHAKPKTSPSMYRLGCLQNQKHSTESTCLARASAGTAGGLGGRGGSLLPWGEINIFFLRFMSLVNKENLNDMVYEIQLVFSCVSTCVPTHHHRETEKRVWSLSLSWVLQKVQNSPQG